MGALGLEVEAWAGLEVEAWAVRAALGVAPPQTPTLKGPAWGHQAGGAGFPAGQSWRRGKGRRDSKGRGG